MTPARAMGALAFLLLPSNLAVRELLGARPAVSAEAPLVVLHGTISRGATLGSLLARDLSPPGVQALVEAARPVYNLARLSVGHPFDLTLGPGGLLAAFHYGIDELRTLSVMRREGVLRADVVKRRYDVSIDTVRGVILSNLFAAVNQAAEADQLALDLADIFAWDVDFHTELQKGDSFQAAVERMSLDGRFIQHGRILAAEFARGPRILQAVWFDERQGYYAPDGTSLRKAFLRSPLKYTRISSPFTHTRLHPILGAVTPHLGIDYAAPEGTPVMASGDGIVALAGWYGGFGQAVVLRHPHGYETLYGHLSRIGVRRGQRVAQGAILGAVGSTGLATGPHLDYRMSRNGRFLNPLTVSLPPAEPIPSGDEAAFSVLRDHELALLQPTGTPRALESTLLR